MPFKCLDIINCIKMATTRYLSPSGRQTVSIYNAKYVKYKNETHICFKKSKYEFVGHSEEIMTLSNCPCCEGYRKKKEQGPVR